VHFTVKFPKNNNLILMLIRQIKSFLWNNIIKASQMNICASHFCCLTSNAKFFSDEYILVSLCNSALPVPLEWLKLLYTCWKYHTTCIFHWCLVTWHLNLLLKWEYYTNFVCINMCFYTMNFQIEKRIMKHCFNW